jgi:poly-gamma-glutamate synthesis protein (capsule biosynthesis protein)
MDPPRAFYFRADPIAVEVLKKAGVDYVTLANNHVLDYGYDALEDTFKILKREHIAWAGAGENIREAKKPAILQSPKVKVGILAATDNSPEYGATTDHSGTWYIRIPPPASFYEEVSERIQELRREGMDLIVFSVHWGPNMVEAPPPEHRKMAHRLIDVGVDIVHGHSAHTFQGIEIYKGKIIFYDTGDFVDDYWVSQWIDEQFLYLVRGEKGTLKEIELIPVKISNYQVNLADPVTGKRAIKRIQERSQALGTELREKDSRGIIQIS